MRGKPRRHGLTYITVCFEYQVVFFVDQFHIPKSGPTKGPMGPVRGSKSQPLTQKGIAATDFPIDFDRRAASRT